MNVVSLFAGCGGLDLGFKKAGFNLVWANEYDQDIWETFEKNHPGVPLDRRSITKIESKEIPECDGIIGGPPCQSWSEAGAQRGIKDSRGKLFFDFIRILQEKQPKFFLAENVSGMLAYKHRPAINNIIRSFAEAGYNVVYKLLNAKNFNVPQDRNRVIFVGYRIDIGRPFIFPIARTKISKLRDVIWDLRDSAIPAKDGNKTNGADCILPNHEYMIGGFSTIYMSRNRVRSWDEPSFTIQAGGRHAPLHPHAPKMLFVEQDKRVFAPGKEMLYRRLSVRECARIQTFPDDFIFQYRNLAEAYKMIGNAVPVNFAYALATRIAADLSSNVEKISQEECSQNMDSERHQLVLI